MIFGFACFILDNSVKFLFLLASHSVEGEIFNTICKLSFELVQGYK